MSVDPILGSYLSGKPNGGVLNPININLTRYAAQNPVKYIDPNGLNEAAAPGTSTPPRERPKPKLKLPGWLRLLSKLASLSRGESPEDDYVTVYRGTSRLAEQQAHAETSFILSDAAQEGYFSYPGSSASKKLKDSGGRFQLDYAIMQSGAAHKKATRQAGGEASLAAMHSQGVGEYPYKPRTFISLTTDPKKALEFAVGPDSSNPNPNAMVYAARVHKKYLLRTPGGGESEYLARHAIRMTPMPRLLKKKQ